jgi:hypothetical protein
MDGLPAGMLIPQQAITDIWPLQDIQRLIHLRNVDFLSIDQIAFAMQRSRNAVISKLRSLHILVPPERIATCGKGVAVTAARRGIPVGPRKQAASKPASEPAYEKPDQMPIAALGIAVSPLPALPLPASAPPPIVVLKPRKCLFPLWADREQPTHVYCDEPVSHGKSYCAKHNALCWQRTHARA